MNRQARRTVFDIVVGALLGVALVWLATAAMLGALVRADSTCTSCHAMTPYAEVHRASAHATVGCSDCHGAEGRFRYVADGLALERRFVASTLGVQPASGRISDRGCRSCHDSQVREVIVADGMRVRHADFEQARCAECHGGVAHGLSGRRYTVPEMDACLGCHQVSATELGTCAICHTESGARVERTANTSWRTTHGSEWRTTHGMGDLSSCRSCHQPAFCADCHGTPLPHPNAWASRHGVGMTSSLRHKCERCHARRWCDECHGMPMPHPTGFIADHPGAAKRSGKPACVRCHAAASCDACHTTARHKKVDGVRRIHEVSE